MSIEEAVRISHCASLQDYNCVGVCTIGPKGVKLDCQLCGSGEAGLNTTREYIKLQEVLRVIKIDINMIDRESVVKMIRSLK